MSKDKRIIPRRNKKWKLLGVTIALEDMKKHLEFRLYANRINGEVWAQKEYDFDSPDVIDVTKILLKNGMTLCERNVYRVVEPLLDKDHIKLYKPYYDDGREGGKIDPEIKRDLDVEHNRKALKIAIEEAEGCDYLKDIPLLAKCKNPLNKADFERLCAMQCSKTEFTYFFGCDDTVLSEWCKSTYGMKFKDIFEIKRQGGYISLRHSHMKMAETVPMMNKFLSINYLGLSEDGGKAEEENNKIDKLIEAIKNIE